MKRVLMFKATEQELIKDPSCSFEGIVSGTRGYLRARFSFNKTWNGCARIAVFRKLLDEYPVVLRDDSCEIPAEVHYILAEPIITQISDEDAIALMSLKTFDTVTYISTDSELQPVIDLEYGTSKVGGYTLECYNDKEVMKLEIAAMKAAQTTTEEVTE